MKIIIDKWKPPGSEVSIAARLGIDIPKLPIPGAASSENRSPLEGVTFGADAVRPTLRGIPEAAGGFTATHGNDQADRELLISF